MMNLSHRSTELVFKLIELVLGSSIVVSVVMLYAIEAGLLQLPTSPIELAIIGGLSIVVLMHGWRLFQAARSYRFVPTTGTLDDDVSTIRNDDGDVIKVLVTYSYTALGTQYQGHRFTVENAVWIRDVYPQLRRHAKLEVFCNPDCPSESVLVRGIPAGAILVFVPLLIVLIGTVVFFANDWSLPGFAIDANARPSVL